MKNKKKKDKLMNNGGTEGARRATGVPPSSVESPPDPEVPAKRRRRNLTAAYKLKILQKIDECDEPGQVGALLRREGLYSSNITRWRKQRDQGILTAMSPKKRGRKKVKNPMTNEVAKLQKENEKLRKKLWQAERIIEVQKKISEILSIEQNLDQNEEDDS
jgi:transposase